MDYILERLERAAELEKTGNWQEVLTHSKEWAAAEPHNLFAWQGIGDSLTQLGMVEEAISAYRKGLEVAPPHPADFFGRKLSAGPLWYRLGNAYTKLGDSAKAIDAFREAARIDPEVAEIWNNLGIAYTNANNPQEAAKAFKSGVAAAPTNVTILTNLGIVYARCGVEQGVISVHRMISRLDTRAASTFLKDAEQILSSR
ncbi:tetratricopeptide repeat protein [Nitrosospira sp. NRS527]|uniref:tetratricopeptide repeat protein n=1 Tax=Nitrosospira sp. NRS527 TaxID=155925 RepID=UPI001AFAC44F|nr:tetratricopeptide repeat protein [Nitrosospira sp. NRS527]BCT68806.1 hypothetical protein NNRS527_02412 [Nitrosospira sp. NRS527]